jgi:Fic family protein
MVFHKIKKKGTKSYNYLILAFKFKGRGYQIQRYIGTGKIGRKKTSDLKTEYHDWFRNEALKKRAKISAARFASTILTSGKLELIEKIRFVYSEYCRRFFPNEVEKLERDFELSYIHSTTATEGNTSTLEDVTRLLEDGITPKGRSLREVYEIRNFEDVLAFRKKYRKGPSLKLILKSHKLVMRDIDLYTIGALRRIEVGIRGSDVRLVPAVLVEEELYKLLMWYQEEKEKIHPIELAAQFHERFEQIHPFTDGNGRVGRELFNIIVTQKGYPPLNFNVKRREEYLDSLESAQRGDLRPFMDYIIENYLEQMRTRLGDHPLKDVLQEK